MKSLSTGALESLVNLGMLSTKNNLPASGLLLMRTTAHNSDIMSFHCLVSSMFSKGKDILTCEDQCRMVE